MKIIKEAHTDVYKFIVGPDYVTIDGIHSDGSAAVVLRMDEAREAFGWVNEQINRVLPEVIQVTPGLVIPMTKPGIVTSKSETLYNPPGFEDRVASTTTQLKLGDPYLAHHLGGGRTGASGDGDTEITDLAVLAGKVGKL